MQEKNAEKGSSSLALTLFYGLQHELLTTVRTG